MFGPGWQDLLDEDDLPPGEDAMDHLDDTYDDPSVIETDKTYPEYWDGLPRR